MRPFIRLSFPWLPFLAFAGALSACSSDADEATTAPGPGSTDNTPPGETKPPDPTTPAAIDAQPATLTQLLAGWNNQSGYYHPPTKRAFSLHSGLASTLQRVTVAKLGATTADVSTLPVKGKVPTGHIEAMTYDASSDRFVMIVRAYQPQPRLDVVTLALGETDATFETLTQPSPLKSDGYMFRDMYPRGGGGVLIVPRGNELLTLTIANGTATWTTINPTQNPILKASGNPIIVDAARNRLLSFGKFDYDFATKKGKTISVVQTMPLSGPYTWSDLTLANQPPDVSDQAGLGLAWAVLDSKGQRFFTTIPETTTCPPPQPTGPCIMQRLWVADIAKNSWTKLQDNFYQNGSVPFATDDDARRVLTVGDGTLHAMSIDDKTPLATSAFVMNGDLGPSFTSDAVVLSNGKLLASAGARFRVFDPAAAAPRWETFGKASLPPTHTYRTSFTEDPATGEVLVFGGSGNPPSNDLYALAKDGSTLTKLTAESASAPAARSLHGAIIAGQKLVVVGGSSASTSGSEGVALDDVWTLDRAAKPGKWAKTASLPTKLTAVTLHAVSATEVWAIGTQPSTTSGESSTIAPVVSIDLASGKVRTVEAHGATKPPTRLWSVAPLGSCFVGFESGDTVDGTQPQLWRCKKDGDGLVWETSPLDANDYGLGGMISLRGTSTPDASRAFFVGPTIWATQGPKK